MKNIPHLHHDGEADYDHIAAELASHSPGTAEFQQALAQAATWHLTCLSADPALSAARRRAIAEERKLHPADEQAEQLAVLTAMGRPDFESIGRIEQTAPVEVLRIAHALLMRKGNTAARCRSLQAQIEQRQSKLQNPKSKIQNSPVPVPVPIDRIFPDESLQIRCEVDGDQVDNIKEAIAAGADLPPIDLFAKDDFADPSYLIGDGWHRYYAHIAAEKKEILANIHPGGRAAALKHALGANAAHGLRRTNADKRRAVEVATAEFPRLSHRAIAELCKVDHKTVARWRKEAGGEVPHLVTGADGKEYPAAKPQPTPEDEVKRMAEKAREQLEKPLVQLELTFGDDLAADWLPHVDPDLLPRLKARLKDLSDKIEAIIRQTHLAQKKAK